MWEKYGNDVQFFVVYIREAHALDSRSPLGGNGMPVMEDPVTLIERKNAATMCMSKMALEPIPALLDGMDDQVSQAYQAWPDRLYLVGKDGKIAFKGGPGPFQFRPGELEEAIEKELEGTREALPQKIF